MKPGFVYRICSKCGRVINVSRLEKGGRKYVCPACAGEPWFMTRDALCKGLWFENERREQEEWRQRYEQLRREGGRPRGEQDEIPEK